MPLTTSSCATYSGCNLARALSVDADIMPFLLYSSAALVNDSYAPCKFSALPRNSEKASLASLTACSSSSKLSASSSVASVNSTVLSLASVFQPTNLSNASIKPPIVVDEPSYAFVSSPSASLTSCAVSANVVASLYVAS